MEAELHYFVFVRNEQKVEELLGQGVDVDCVDHLGQTCLFRASLLGVTSLVRRLLHYGANPNHRCKDRSTPVHAAAFSCDTWLLRELLNAGGDLGVQDNQGKVPRVWAELKPPEHSNEMVTFIMSQDVPHK